MGKFEKLIGTLMLNCLFLVGAKSAELPDNDTLFQANQSNLLAALTDTSNAMFNRLTFYYVGPFGWSKPESRLVVGSGPNATVEYLELSKSSVVIAGDMVETGHSDVSNALINGAKHHLSFPLSQCPAISNMIDDLEDLAVAEIGKSRQLESEGKKIVTFDGGGSYHFYFGHMGAKEFGFVTFVDGPTSKKMAELERFVLSCLM